ncbi:MAG: hypothetical protein ACREP4_12935 [Stenotrophomonas sp.]|uniref:hypothetical protein n=1 Tax=Stenotrophomonas sp. TaxID=69392 RepID=UPI003D6D7039
MQRRFGESYLPGNAPADRTEASAKEVAIGQKSAIRAVLITATVVVAMMIAPTLGISEQAGAYVVLGAWALLLVASIMSVYGMIKISNGLGWSFLTKAFVFLLLFVPLISTITVLVLSAKATAFLRGAGYKVGLLGAYR